MSDEAQATAAAQDAATTEAATKGASEEEETQQDSFPREYVEKLRKESATYRTRAKELETAVEEAKKEAERAKLDDLERLQAERDDLKKQLEAATAQARTADLRAQVAGSVTDIEYALFRIEKDSDTYLDSDGKVDIEKLLADNPTIKPQPDPKPGPAPTSAGGGQAKGLDMNTFIRRKAGRS